MEYSARFFMWQFIVLIFISAWLPILAAQESEPLPLLQQEYQYDLVYSIQLAAYDLPEKGQNFAAQHADIPMFCRTRNNGVFAVYYGVFESYSDARQHLGDYDLLYNLNAYVVKLPKVSFDPCVNLDEKIEMSRRDAFNQRECANCDVKGLVESFIPELVAPNLESSLAPQYSDPQ